MDRREFIAASVVGTAASAFATQVATAAPSSKRPRKVLAPAVDDEHLSELAAAAPDLELVVCRNQQEALKRAPEADASLGFITQGLIQAGKSLQWVQQFSAGVEHLMEIPELVESDIVLTNMQRAYGPEIADHALGYLLAFTRGLAHFVRIQPKQEWPKHQTDVVLDELPGKTAVVIGLGGIGSEISRRAAAFGMRILATDPKVMERPLYVSELHRPDALSSLLPQADVVFSAVPLTRVSRKMLDAKAFGLMKPGVILINVSRGGVVDTDALIAALDSGHVSAAGLDVTDPEPLPSGHPLWARNVIITPHNAGQSTGIARRRHEIVCENLRRFSAGEALLNIVDKKVGY